MDKQALTRRALPALLAGLGFAGISQAQTLLYQFDGLAQYDRSGASVASAGDVNNDGVDDIIVGEPQDFMIFFFGPGQARVFSGANGSVLHTFVGNHDYALFGTTVAGVGDVNGDGYDDVAVGAPNDVSNAGSNSGLVRVFSGLDGSVLRNFYGDNNGGLLGSSLANAGDVDGDGVDDIIAGAPFADVTGGQGAGYARVFSGATGAVLHTIEGTSGNEHFGQAVCGLGNVNPNVIVNAGNPPSPQLDYFGDFAIGSNADVVNLYSGFDGAVLQALSPHPAGPAGLPGATGPDLYGVSLARVHDLDADGIDDIAIGAVESGVFSAGPGYIEVRSSAPGSGALLLSKVGLAVGDNFGTAVSDAGDWDGDGVHDVIVGSKPTNNTVDSYGMILSGADASVLATILGDNPEDALGYSVAGLGDIDGDSHVEVILGAPHYDGPGLGSGLSRVFSSPFSSCGGITTYCPTTPNSVGAGATMSAFGDTSVSGTGFGFFISGVPANEFGLVFYGDLQTSMPLYDGNICVSGTPDHFKRFDVISANAGGIAIQTVDFASITDPNLQIVGGSTWNFQFWYRDPAGGTGADFSDAVSVTFCD